jgi:methylphosphotriester-DNA--protein-cysteine methyltransferase
MTLHATYVTAAPDSRRPRPCKRCGVLRHTKGKRGPLCRDCLVYIHAHGEEAVWL